MTRKLFPLLLLFAATPVMAGGVADTESFRSGYKPDLEREFIALIGSSDLAAGEKTFMRKCAACHDHEKDAGHGKGPHLWEIVGRKAGAVPGFEFSDAMRQAGHHWSLAALNHYLTNTERAVPGRVMEFRGIRRDKERARLLAFLLTLSDSPKPLP